MTLILWSINAINLKLNQKLLLKKHTAISYGSTTVLKICFVFKLYCLGGGCIDFTKRRNLHE